MEGDDEESSRRESLDMLMKVLISSDLGDGRHGEIWKRMQRVRARTKVKGSNVRR